ncbi:hypothetical protein ACQ33O_06295 [Ferruginibacter sp. SUN002]|uniref:hypothetical protein n=1 Tax=Ferruginibacter sp. SUN002 TaxID=2937789 RepID=UPI003D36961F
MIRRNLHFVLMVSAMFVCSFASAQLYIDNAQFFIQSGATVTVQGDVTSNADIQGTGKLQLKGSGNQNISMSGKTIPFLEIDNVANATLTSSAKVSDSILFTNGNIILGANNLALGTTTGKIVNAASTRFVVTNGAGKLVKAALGASAFTYPVGNSTSTYNPVSISNSGTADSIAVRCLANALSQGTTGTAFTKEVVDASWDISESVAGGSSLSVTANWATSDQLDNFNIAKPTGLSYYVTSPAASVGWDLLNSAAAVASAGTPNYSVTRTGITTLGTFAVGQRPVLSPLLIAPKVFLQGAYNTGTNLMNTGLATLVQIPLNEPYTGMTGFTHSGSGGGEKVSATSVFTTNSIVDWVFVQLHNGAGTVVSTRAGLLKNDGTIVETDGVTPLSMAGNAPGSYFFSVRHRNHLGVRSAVAQDLSAAKVTTFSYNFASGLAQALAPAANAAMTNKYGSGITTPNYMLWAGNPSLNNRVAYSGGGNDENVLLNNAPLSGNKSAAGSAVGYWLGDLNLSGKVTYSGGANDENLLLNISLLGNKTATGILQAAF